MSRSRQSLRLLVPRPGSTEKVRYSRGPKSLAIPARAALKLETSIGRTESAASGIRDQEEALTERGAGGQQGCGGEDDHETRN